MTLRELLDDATMRTTPPFTCERTGWGQLPYVTYSRGGKPDVMKSELVYVNAAKWSDSITQLVMAEAMEYSVLHVFPSTGPLLGGSPLERLPLDA
jgi:hypothetical protein